MNHDLISRQLHYDFRTKHGNSWLFSQFFFMLPFSRSRCSVLVMRKYQLAYSSCGIELVGSDGEHGCVLRLPGFLIVNDGSVRIIGTSL
jgi:hypothetical protein